MELAEEKHMEALDCYRNMAVVSEDDYNDAVTDDEGVTYSKDGKRLLKGAESMDYVVRDGTEVICNGAFEFENVRNVKFPKSLRYIGNKAFGYCWNISLPEGLLGIGDEAFLLTGCNEQLRIPDSVVYLGKYAFCGSWVTELIIGKGIKRIEEGAFSNIKANSVTIGDSVTYIGNQAFGENYLDEIVIPQSVQELEGNPFGGDIKRIVSLSDAYVVKDDILYSKDGKELICCFSRAKELVIPDTVEDVHSFASSCSEAEAITLPDSVRSIGSAAFYRAKTKFVHLPEGLRTIPKMAFEDSRIESIVIPNTVEKIECWAFSGCKSLKTVQMSNMIETIEEHAFTYCFNLESIKLPTTLKTIGDKAFFCCHKLKEREDELGISID